MILREARSTIALALPIIGTQLAQVAINTTDVLLLARFSETALAASALGMSAFFVVWVIGLGLAMATPALAAQALGHDAGDIATVRHAVQDGLLLVLVYGLCTGPVFWFAEPLLIFAGQPADLSAEAAVFLWSLWIGMVPSLWFVVLRGFISALQRPRAAMLLMVAAVVMNAVVNYGLIFGALGLPPLGLLGAGLGSSLVHTCTFLGLAWVIARDPQFRAYGISHGWWRSTSARLFAFLRVGAPVALTLGAEIGLFSAAALLMGHLGASEVAAHQLALQWAAIAFMVPMGIAQAATVRVGLAAGAGDRAGAIRAASAALVLGVGFMACTALLFWQGRELLIGFFLPAGDSPVFRLAVAYLAWAGLFQIADGAQAVANGALRGLKDTAVPMLLAGFGYWLVGLPMAAWCALATPMRGDGVWLGLVAGLFLVAALLLWRLFLVLRRRPA